MKMDDIIEKLNRFSDILLDNQLVQESIYFVENKSDDAKYQWQSSQGFLYLNDQNLALCRECWDEVCDRVKMQETQLICDLVQYFDLMYGSSLNFERPTLFLNERFVAKDGIEKFQALQELMKVKLTEEMAVFLGQYPDLLSLFLAVRNKDLTVLQQAESIATVELLGQAVPDFYAQFCRDIQEGKAVNRIGMTFYILQYAMLTRYFPQTGQVDWMSKDYHAAELIRVEEFSQQKQRLIQEAKFSYMKKLKDIFMEHVEVMQLQKEIFPHGSNLVYEQSVQALLEKIGTDV